MNSYQKRLQEIAYLKERVAQLEALLPPATVRQLDQDELNKRRTQALDFYIQGNTLISGKNLRQESPQTQGVTNTWQHRSFREILGRIGKHLKIS